MVQMHTLSTSTTTTTGVSYEAEGGIRNPACQDEDTTDSKPFPRQQQQQQQQQQQRGTGAREPGKKVEEPCNIQEKSQEFRKIMTVCYTRVPWRFSFNFVIAVAVSILMILGAIGAIPNQTIGFYCNDPKISHKFTGDTISMGLLLATTIILPGLVIWATEWSCYSPDSYKSLECSSSSRSRQFWQWYGYYTLGWWYMIFVVEVLKIVVGEPRPHFIDSCRPKEIVNCTDEYKKSYTCTNTELSWFYVNDSDKSFPSGHAALSVFTATFLVWYLQNRMPERLALLLVKPWLQCMAVLWGLGCGLSRVTDHRHHWWDVAIGSGIGLGFAVFVVRVLCKCFRSGSTGSAPPHGGQPDGRPGANGTLGSRGGYPGKHHHHHKSQHQSVKKLLSNGGSGIEAPEDRELGDMPVTWTA